MFTSAHLHLCSCSHLHIYISAHLHILTSIISHLHLSLFFTFSLKAGGGAAGAPRNATLCGDRARRGREMQARVRFGPIAGNPVRRSCASRARNAGESAFWLGPAQPSAEIARVEGAKSRRECVLARSGATLRGDRACRGREMQARVHFGFGAGNPLRRSCVSRARNAGESAFWIGRAPLLEDVSYENARFGDLALHFWRTSRTKRWFWRLGASLLEEVSYENVTLVLETWRFTFGGSLVQLFGAGLRSGQFVVHM